jgi:cytidylate kinase
MSIVTISRGCCIGGRAIAEELAKRLGCPCVSFEDLCRALSRFEGFTRKIVDSAFADPASLSDHPAQRIALLNILKAALVNLSENGNFVYHGFAGHLLLANVPNILRVRINASLDFRTHEAMQLHGVNHDQALLLIRKEDEDSAIWSHVLYEVDGDDPSLFDVCLSLNTIGIEETVQVLAQMSRLEAFTPTETSRREIRDLLLGSTVWATLNTDPRTDGASVMVVASLDHVTVYGHASNEKVVRAIPLVARKVEGVNEVTCNVNLVPEALSSCAKGYGSDAGERSA